MVNRAVFHFSSTDITLSCLVFQEVALCSTATVEELEEEEELEAVEIQSGPPSRHNSGHSRGRSGRGQEEVRPTFGLEISFFTFRLKQELSFENILTSLSNFLSQKSINESLSPQASDVSQTAPLVVRTSQSGIIPDTPSQNIIGLSDLIPDNKEIDPTFQVNLLII